MSIYQACAWDHELDRISRLLRFLLNNSVFAVIVFYVVCDLVVPKPPGLLQWREVPPVLGASVDLGRFEEELYAVHLALGGRDVDRSAAIVVGSIEIDALEVMPENGKFEVLYQF
jgi:hypothetical protein